MPYKYKSILKSFQYSKENYQVISDFLLSGAKSNPNILLNVTKISKEFGKEPRHWFQLESTLNFIKALIQIKLEANNKKLKTAFRKFISNEEKTNRGISAVGKNYDFIAILELLNQKQFIKLIKAIGLIIVKKGGNDRTLTGTWIHKDLAVKYAEWLDPKFSIWISQKIQELLNDGVSWNEIRDITKIDYKPLILAIEKYVMPKYPKMDEDILKGRIANFINIKVIGQKAKEIREEKGIEPHELTRDFFTKEELIQIEKLQVFTEILISQFKLHDFQSLEERINLYEF